VAIVWAKRDVERGVPLGLVQLQSRNNRRELKEGRVGIFQTGVVSPAQGSEEIIEGAGAEK